MKAQYDSLKLFNNGKDFIQLSWDFINCARRADIKY